jgi:ribosomal-protein-alanine N-acetyltransferase
MTFSTETFKLEALKYEDASSLNALMISNGKRFQEYLPKTLAQNLSVSDSKKYIAEKNSAIENQIEYTFAIKDIDTNQVAGLIILKNLDFEIRQSEFAYCLGTKFLGKGWMTQSVQATISFAHNKLGLKRFQIITHKTNISSVLIAKRCNFKWIKTLPNEFRPSGRNPIDMELYELHYEG